MVIKTGSYAKVLKELNISVNAYTPAKGGQQLKRVFSVDTSDLKDDQ